MGRFVNADAYTSTGQGLLGSNMFAYCGNNPIDNYDPDGHRILESHHIGPEMMLFESRTRDWWSPSPWDEKGSLIVTPYDKLVDCMQEFVIDLGNWIKEDLKEDVSHGLGIGIATGISTFIRLYFAKEVATATALTYAGQAALKAFIGVFSISTVTEFVGEILGDKIEEIVDKIWP